MIILLKREIIVSVQGFFLLGIVYNSMMFREKFSNDFSNDFFLFLKISPDFPSFLYYLTKDTTEAKCFVYFKARFFCDFFFFLTGPYWEDNALTICF